MSSIRAMLDFFAIDIWHIRPDDASPVKSYLIKQLQIIVLSVQEFIEDRCFLRASALTFYSLLSIGPVVAMVFGIAKGFGLQKQLESQVIQKIPAQEEVLSQILNYAQVLLENTKGGVIAGVGVILLLWSVLKLLNHIELSFNDIWQIKRTRSWRQRFSNYLAFMVIAPFLLLMYTSVPAFISSHINMLGNKFFVFQKFSPVVFATLKLFPYLLIWGVFTFIYILIPNTRVRFASALLGGIVAGTIYLVVQWLYINFQIGVARYNPIYGSLAALPLLLIWLNIGWAIILFGAEYSYAHLNITTHEYTPGYSDMSPHTQKLLALKILQLIAARFTAGAPALDSAEIAKNLELPARAIQRVLRLLLDSSLLVRSCRQENDPPTYQPASDIGGWTVASVCDALEKRNAGRMPTELQEQFAGIANILEKFRAAVESSPDNVLIKDIDG
jgi:membrane protein